MSEFLYYNRVVELTITSIKGIKKTFLYDKENESEFAIEFESEFGVGKVSTVKLYNPNKTTLDLVQKSEPKPNKKTEYASLELQAGYQSGQGIVCTGNIIDSHFKKQNADYVLEMKISNSKSQLDQFVEGQKNFFNQKVSQIFNQMLPANDISNFNLNFELDPVVKQFAITGTVFQTITALCDLCEASFYFQLEKLIIEGNNKTEFIKSDLNIPSFDYKSGLVGSVEQKGSTYKVSTLLEPKILIGKLIKLKFLNINKEPIEGKFKILRGKHSGGTHIQKFNSEFECSKIS